MTLARLAPDHQGAKLAHYDGDNSEVYLGIWYGRAERYEGGSRRNQSRILNTHGGFIFTTEEHMELTIGDRVHYRMGFDRLGIEAQAVGIEPIEPVAPATGSKIALKSKSK
jgi:hypothetical protein